jgi:membrane protein YqaA with SNARE-associated domain
MPLVIVAVWALAEASLFFIVADVPISAIGLKYGVKRALLAALVATLAAAVGGEIVLAWSAADPEGSRAALAQVPAITPAVIDRAAADYARGGTLAMLAAAFRGVPYKLYAHAAGIAGSGAASFFLASCIARLPRFALVAVVFGWLGDALRPRFSSRVIAITGLVGWTSFYLLYFAAMAL